MTLPDQLARVSSRYLVGCTGQFFLNQDSGGASPLHGSTNDEDEAFAMCETGPVGCEVYDTLTRRWIGPVCQEEIDEAKARLADRLTPDEFRDRTED